MNKDKYIQEAVDEILEILDGMSFDEIFEISLEVNGAVDEGKSEYFSYAEYVLTHKQGDKNA